MALDNGQFLSFKGLSVIYRAESIIQIFEWP